ncbi:MAG: hypothetical protein N2C14_28540, partial [Planctomycetales bacterium]
MSDDADFKKIHWARDQYGDWEKTSKTQLPKIAADPRFGPGADVFIQTEGRDEEEHLIGEWHKIGRLISWRRVGSGEAARWDRIQELRQLHGDQVRFRPGLADLSRIPTHAADEILAAINAPFQDRVPPRLTLSAEDFRDLQLAVTLAESSSTLPELSKTSDETVDESVAESITENEVETET